MLKKDLDPNVSNSFIDEIYSSAMANGAIGGRLLGAGGGGFLILYVQENNRKQLLKSLNGLQELPIEFKYEGSTILF